MGQTKTYHLPSHFLGVILIIQSSHDELSFNRYVEKKKRLEYPKPNIVSNTVAAIDCHPHRQRSHVTHV